MESAAGSVRSHFETAGTLVARPQLLRYGTEDAIDSAIRSLLEKRIIIRVANGVYALLSRLTEMPSAQQIIEAKAAAFGKRVFPAASKGSSKEFWTDGCRTTFNSIHGPLKFKTRSPRKLKQLSSSKQEKDSEPDDQAKSSEQPARTEQISKKNESIESNPLNSISRRLLGIINQAGIRLSQIAYAGLWSSDSHCLIYDFPSA